MKQKPPARLLVLFIAVAALCSHCGKKECVEPVEDPSLAADIQPVFSAGCAISGCHDAAAASGGLILVSGQSYGQLVDEPSVLEPDNIRVVPGDAENSYLVIKLEDRQSVGEAMPLGGSLSSDEIHLIRNWIDAGAEND